MRLFPCFALLLASSPAFAQWEDTSVVDLRDIDWGRANAGLMKFQDECIRKRADDPLEAVRKRLHVPEPGQSPERIAVKAVGNTVVPLEARRAMREAFEARPGDRDRILFQQPARWQITIANGNADIVFAGGDRLHEALRDLADRVKEERSVALVFGLHVESSRPTDKGDRREVASAWAGVTAGGEAAPIRGGFEDVDFEDSRCDVRNDSSWQARAEEKRASTFVHRVPRSHRWAQSKGARSAVRRQLRGPVTCGHCAGDGEFHCPRCGDVRTVICTRCNGGLEEDCGRCGGSGRLTCPPTETCGTCRGYGELSCGYCGGRGRVNRIEATKEWILVEENGNWVWRDFPASRSVEVNCESCGGSGRSGTCGTCSGSGEVTCSRCHGSGVVTCGTCGGDGRVPCRLCDGTGRITCPYCDGGPIECPLCEGEKRLEPLARKERDARPTRVARADIEREEKEGAARRAARKNNVAGTPWNGDERILAGADGLLRPAKGFRWVSARPGDLRVEADAGGSEAPGQPYQGNPCIVWGPNGQIRPAAGYRWVSAEPGDFRVELAQSGAPHPTRQGIVLDRAGCLYPMPGCEWTSPGPRELGVAPQSGAGQGGTTLERLAWLSSEYGRAHDHKNGYDDGGGRAPLPGLVPSATGKPVEAPKPEIPEAVRNSPGYRKLETEQKRLTEERTQVNTELTKVREEIKNAPPEKKEELDRKEEELSKKQAVVETNLKANEEETKRLVDRKVEFEEEEEEPAK